MKMRNAFTIVELLIVVVVIAILAAITIVAYNGITANAKDSALKSDLATTAKKVGLIQAEQGAYPSTKPSDLPDYIQYSQTNAGQGFCATASKEGRAFNITQAGTIQTGACSGHTVAGGGEVLATMQSFTSSDCASLPVFTGSNVGAIVQLTDSRGGITQVYEIAKLADSKCWMLTNLKLGSTAGVITLTPSDSDVSSNFTLPQVVAGTASSYDVPQAVGPIPGDTGSGTENYGYLYNWPAATAGETLATKPAGSGDAVNSICPANWRLPSGGEWNDASNDFSVLNARMAGLSGVTDAGYTNSNYTGATFRSNWYSSGPFRGLFAGRWWHVSFDGQGESGFFWSRTAHPSPSEAGSAYRANFTTTHVFPYNYRDRYEWYSLRCILG